MDFLSHAALVGFMAGAAIIIGLQQLKGLLGISHFTSKTDVASVLVSVYKSLHHQITSGENVSWFHNLICVFIKFSSFFFASENITQLLSHEFLALNFV